MAFTWLELIQATTAEMGLGEPPATVAAAQDLQTRQIGALANRCGDMVVRHRDWVALQAEWPIEVLAPITRTGNLTAGSAVVTGLSSTTGLIAGAMGVLGDQLTQATRLASVDSATQVTLTQVSNVTATGASLTFSFDTYDAPSDMLAPINRTMWDRTRRWELVGPMSPQEDEWMRSGIVATGPRRRFRFIGRTSRQFRIWPPPTAVDAPATLVFEYITNNWAQDVTGTPKPKFTLDTDTCVFDDDVMLMGVKWLFLQAKGMEYAAMREAWLRALGNAAANDGAAPTLDMARGRWPILIGPGNIPDTGYGR